MSNSVQYWRNTARVYEEMATEYDSWFENNLLFKSEVAALKSIRPSLDDPALEIGIGPGRFAESLGIKFGIDPAFSPLLIAQERGVCTCQAVGEHLPFTDNTFSSGYILFTECFLKSPASVFMECRRVLKENGRLVVGMIPADSRWGQSLIQKGLAGNPFYSTAKFSRVCDLEKVLLRCGFRTIETVSTLFQNPGNNAFLEKAQKGIFEEAGFVALVCTSMAENQT